MNNDQLTEAAGNAAYALLRDGESMDGAAKARIFATVLSAVRLSGWTESSGERLACDAVDGHTNSELVAAKKRAESISDPWAAWEARHVNREGVADGRLLRRLLREQTQEQDGGLIDQATKFDTFEDVEEVAFLPTPSFGDRVFPERMVWTISGHKKSGKSWAMLMVTLDALRSGREVVYFDFENGTNRFKRRLRDQGVKPEDVAGLSYVSFPKLSLETFGTELLRIAAEKPGAFVVFDSFRGLCGALSTPSHPIKANDAGDIERVFSPIREATEAGLTFGIIDHTTKSGSENDEYSTAGSGAKEAAVDLIYFWTKVHDYSKTRVGSVRLSTTDQRDGETDTSWEWGIGGQGDAPVTLAALSAEEARGSLTKLATARQFVRREGNAGKRFTKTELRSLIGGDKTKVDAALEVMLTEDAAFFHEKAEGDNYPKYVWDPERIA